MGRCDALTADVLEWLSSDDRVASRWRALAARLGLDAGLVATIDAHASHRDRKSDRQKLKVSDVIKTILVVVTGEGGAPGY
jgi:hypothetical protein